MMRFIRTLLVAGLACTLSTLTFASAYRGDSNLTITVRDSYSGKRVGGAELRSVAGGVEIDRGTTSIDGRGAVFARGYTKIEVSAEGYDPIQTHFILGSEPLNVTVWLDPTDLKLRLSRPETESPDATVVSGYVYDEQGAPLAGAFVSLRSSGVGANVASDGYFEFTVVTPAYRSNELPSTDTLVVTNRGREVYTRPSTMLPGGRMDLIIDTDETPQEVDGRHKFDLTREELAAGFSQPRVEPSYFATAPTAVAVPPSIRVGSSCPTATTCTVFTVYTLETYVRNGLDDEWIASWNANSLKAGAIAYRSYGAYHVYHPRVPANYDICNTTSCQVNDPADNFAASNSATLQTAGSLVVNASATDVLFSEYSAENNLAPGCPDGSTGRPEHNWPCLADPVDVGTTYFGHGRGMCQWGSQRWSINQGKDFVWIVNHYYNANGNPGGLRNGWLQMSPETLLPPPELTEPGTQTAPGPTISTFAPTFRWTAMDGADGYSLYVSKFNGSTYDVVFNSETVLGQPIQGISYTLPAGILVAGGAYRWNMSAHIPAGYGTPNTFRNYFTVSSLAVISGRVTTPAGLALRNAQVTLVNDQDVRRTATTSSFGLYSFADVPVNQNYTIAVSSKRYRFSPRIMNVTGSLADVDFVGQE